MDENAVIKKLESKNLTNVTRVGDTLKFKASFEVDGVVEEIEVDISADEPAFNSSSGYKCKVRAADETPLIRGNPYGDINYAISEMNWDDLAGKIKLWREQKRRGKR